MKRPPQSEGTKALHHNLFATIFDDPDADMRNDINQKDFPDAKRYGEEFIDLLQNHDYKEAIKCARELLENPRILHRRSEITDTWLMLWWKNIHCIVNSNPRDVIRLLSAHAQTLSSVFTSRRIDTRETHGDGPTTNNNASECSLSGASLIVHSGDSIPATSTPIAHTDVSIPARSAPTETNLLSDIRDLAEFYKQAGIAFNIASFERTGTIMMETGIRILKRVHNQDPPSNALARAFSQLSIIAARNGAYHIALGAAQNAHKVLTGLLKSNSHPDLEQAANNVRIIQQAIENQPVLMTWTNELKELSPNFVTPDNINPRATENAGNIAPQDKINLHALVPGTVAVELERANQPAERAAQFTQAGPQTNNMISSGSPPSAAVSTFFTAVSTTGNSSSVKTNSSSLSMP